MNVMSSIGMSGTSMSPRTMMDKRIDSAVQAGTISQTDETALESALDAIDSAMGMGSSSSASAQTSQLDPSKVGDRIDDLIDQQVKAGTLTQDQANTLQSLFAQNAPPQNAGTGTDGENSDGMAMGGVGGCSGGGRPMGPPPTMASSSSSSSDSSSSDDDSSTTSETDQAKQLDALIAFLNNMREKMASSSNVYDTSGTTSTTASSSTTGLVVNSLA